MSSAIAHDAEIAELLAELELAAAQSEAHAVQQHRHTTSSRMHNSHTIAVDNLKQQSKAAPLLTVAVAAERTRAGASERRATDKHRRSAEMTGVHRRRQVAVLRKRQEVYPNFL
jgi:hypothetical protein